MEVLGLDLDLLAKETLELNNSLRGQFHFDFENQDHFDDLLSGKFEYPAKPGLIYRIDQSRSTFCVRGVSTLNIREEFKKSDDYKGFAFFETESVEVAQAVFDQIFNRRYPFHDDLMFNLSDPGLSWWMEHDESSFKVYFKSYAASNAGKLVKLGPIGDAKMATTLLPHAVEFFRFLFPITESSCTDKVFSVATEPDSDKNFFEFFKNVFLKGKNEFNLSEFNELPQLQAIGSYLSELSALRAFWMRVEGNLHIKTDEIYQ